MKHKKHLPADLSGSEKVKKPSKSRAGTRAQKKAAKKAILPLHKRPIVCPPDRAGRSPLFRLGGLICRALVIWMASAGLVIFLSSALKFGVSNAVVFLTSLCVVVLVMLFSLTRVGKLISPLAAVGAVGAITALRPSLPTDLFYGLLSLYNATLARLNEVGYLVYIRYQVGIGTSTPHSELMTVGVCILTALITLLFAACFVKKVKLIPPAILATTLLVVLLTFNIYSKYESNLGITLVIVSFASVLVMAAYDRLYHAKDARTYDSSFTLFEDSDRPALPPEYEKAMAEKAERKKQKATMRQKRRTHTVTVEDELSDYFGGKKKAKKKKAKDAKTAQDRKEEKKAYKAMMKQVRAVKAYDRITRQSRVAMGGYAAAAVLLTCFIAIALPALTVKDRFNTIDAIDDKMDLARNYVTALLRGDDNELDRLEYEADKDNFEPHSTELKQLEFTGLQMFYIQSRYNTNYYLRGWIGTNYENGAWLAVNQEILEGVDGKDGYYDLFGKDSNPAEEIRYGFYHYMKPELVDDPEYTDNLLTKYQSNTDYGFVSLLVSLRRVNSPDTLTYFPATFDPRYGLMEYNSTDEHKLTFANYYDGLYTGRKFNENGLSYSTMTHATVMTNKYWIENQAALQAAYSLQKEALLARSYIRENADGSVSSYLTLETMKLDGGMTRFDFKETKTRDKATWYFIHNTDTVRRDENNNYVITTDYGILTLYMNGKKVVGATVTDVGSEHLDSIGTPVDVNLVDEYDRGMTDEERTELMAYITMDHRYGNFVYDTYRKDTDSAYLKELADIIVKQAHVEKQETVTESVLDDPETPEDDSFEYEKVITYNSSAPVNLAAHRDASDPEVYIQRDRLVRNVIDYIIDEMGCTYTITPDLTNVDPSLDGVENFLRNTKEGYCVQFASAVTLILRELEIPARYVEGYIGNGLEKISRDDFVYGAYVRDYQAHAWVEVYFDGVGWIQYETTPQYYVGMYGATSAGSTPSAPVLPPEADTTPPVVPDETLPEEDTEEPEDEETTSEEDVTAAIVTKNSLIALGVIAVLVAIVAVIATVVSRARAAEDHRQSIMAQVMENGFGTNTSENDRREMALEMSDSVTGLLSYYGLSPKPGEFRDEYAERIAAELTAPVEGKAPKSGTPELPNIHAALDGMASEEFGHGMSVLEMKQVAALYLFLRRDVKHRIALPDRIKLRYFKRKI